jgi:pimeloyl-ACP methyl ester carboxylesterase
MAMPKVRVKDIEMYYEIHGTGAPLMHIGGLAGDARAWARQIEHLSKHYQVICFDNRGTGRTSCPDMSYSTKLFAEDNLRDIHGRLYRSGDRDQSSTTGTQPNHQLLIR